MLRNLLIPKDWPKSAQMFFGIALENWVRYLLFAGLAWLLAYVVFKNRWWRRKVIQRDPRPADVRRELKWSLLTALIYGVVGTATVTVGTFIGGLKIHRRVDAYGWSWFVVSIVIAILIHDAWFYWTHRLMHHPRLFRLFHRVHHESTNPSPWAAYCFAPPEAVVQASIFPLLAFSLPMQPSAFFAFMIWQVTFNVIGHTGYEYHPRRLLDSWLGKCINTPTHHIQHHERMRGNYGLYFNFWDRMMRTNHRDYESRFEEVANRPLLP